MKDRIVNWGAEKKQIILAAVLLVPLFLLFWTLLPLVFDVFSVTSENRIAYAYVIGFAFLLALGPTLWRAVKKANEKVRTSSGLVGWNVAFIKLWGEMTVLMVWLFYCLVMALVPFNGAFGIRAKMVFSDGGWTALIVLTSVLMLPLANFLAGIVIQKGWLEAAVRAVR